MSTDLIQSHSSNGTMSVATSRQAAEVQAAMVVAKNFPRDETAAILRIKTACKRQGLAECSMYSYPKGKQIVTGASIRLAEAIAQSWGNIDYGLIELEQKPGESSVMAYCWDLETNTRRQMVFQVAHKRVTRESTSLLTDPRDIYELVANQGARRVRACILGVIPGDIQDLAVAECEKTLTSGSGKSLDDRIRDMVIAFDELRVSKDMLEAKLGHPVTACTAQSVVSMQKVYLSIRDGISKREDWFDLNAGKPTSGNSEKPVSRTEQVAAKMKPETMPAPAETNAHEPDAKSTEAETTAPKSKRTTKATESTEPEKPKRPTIESMVKQIEALTRASDLTPLLNRFEGYRLTDDEREALQAAVEKQGPKLK